VPPRLLTPYFKGGALNLPALVTPGLAYRLLVSPDLVNWSATETNTPTASPFTFIDSQGVTLKKRFYRLVTP